MSLACNTIYNEDCLSGMQKLEAGSIDLVFADPPFNIGYSYDVYHDRQQAEKYLAWCRQWLAEIVRLLKPHGTFWLAIGDDYAADLKVIIEREYQLVCRNWVIWYYTFGVHCVRKFSRSHAHLFYMVKDKNHFVFHEEAVRVPSARQLVYGDRRASPQGRVPDDTWILRPQDVPDGFQPHEDTWYFPRVCGTFKERQGWHGCQMPEQLLGRIILACSNPGDLVLDPFAGSGTTLVVAKKLRRHFIGFELSTQYTERIQARLADITPGDPLAGDPDPLYSAPSTAEGTRLEERRPEQPVSRRLRRLRKSSRASASGSTPLLDKGTADAPLEPSPE